ncbi:MAG TPA: VOC family protein, partial [Rhizomicrobium sp.]|nr:VOC family protein [Rhizomicrobium sp.]
MADNFFWYDVMTSDTEAAGKFYRDVVGWEIQDSGSPGYTLFTVGGRGVAGLMSIPEDAKAMGVPPCWMGYVRVEDVDATAKRITQEGGKLHKGPIEIPGVIRLAVVADPQGAGFLIAKPVPKEAPPTLAAGTPGTIGWRELYAAEWQSAFAFYEKLFGWTKAEAHDMGPLGTYQLFAAGSEAIGGMMTKPPVVPTPYWGYYINVAAIDAAAARIVAGGGKIINGPMQVPGDQWIVQAIDPQGAVFSL